MIQRVQTIFLLAAISLIATMFFYPFAELAAGQEIFVFDYTGFYKFVDNERVQVLHLNSITIFLSIIIALNLVTIFLFKNRKLQMRFAIYNLLLMIGLLGDLFFLLYNSFEQKPEAAFQITIVFPLIAAVFNYMAFRNIRKDELMVKAIDRIR